MNTTLRNVLEHTGAAFEVIGHRDAYTAWERADACVPETVPSSIEFGLRSYW